jgi:MYXO-CTERM domain-containing protein
MSADLVVAAVGAVLEPIGNFVDDATLFPQEEAELDIQATQAAANLAAAQSGATTAAAAEATRQTAIKYAFAAALVLAAVWAFSRRR